MKYTVTARPYRGADYKVREYNTIEEVHNYVKRENCVIPCTYGEAGLVVYENNKRIECWTTQHMMDVLHD